MQLGVDRRVVNGVFAGIADHSDHNPFPVTYHRHDDHSLSTSILPSFSEFSATRSTNTRDSRIFIAHD
jgi:hypothetical protein